jgi:hypothetical protein
MREAWVEVWTVCELIKLIRSPRASFQRWIRLMFQEGPNDEMNQVCNEELNLAVRVFCVPYHYYQDYG